MKNFKLKDLLVTSKYIDRMENMFEASPLSKPEIFYAARIKYDSTKYDQIGIKFSKTRIYC